MRSQNYLGINGNFIFTVSVFYTGVGNKKPDCDAR